MNTMLKKNIHIIERIFRVLFGLILLSLIFVGPKTLWGLLGLAPLATGFFGNCPVYSILGVSTCGAKGCQT